MIADRNIICIASNWWYDPTSKHHVIKLLAERNRVIWVNYHGSRRPRVAVADARAIAGKLTQVVRGPRRVADNITVVTPLVIPLPGSRAALRLNKELLTRQIRAVLRTLPSAPVQLWSFAPDVDYLAGRFDEECLVYYCVDEFSEFAGYDKAGIIRAEAELAGRADLTITTSQSLYDAKRGLCDETVLVTHGVDFEHFASESEQTVPADIAQLPRPIVGFWGMIQDWVDLDLIARVARARPEWSIVLIGESLVDTGVLAALPNVHLLGRRPYARLPAYAAGFDVGMIPFRVNELTRAVNPIKLREYLAAGLPVVSTPLPEVESYRDWVRIARSPGDFVAECQRAVTSSTPQAATARREAMRKETWRAKVATISSHLEQVLCAKSPATTR